LRKLTTSTDFDGTDLDKLFFVYKHMKRLYNSAIQKHEIIFVCKTRN